MLDTLAAFIVRLGAGLAIFLEREAGYEVISFLLICAGMATLDAGARSQAAHDLVVFGLGVLSRSMGQKVPKATL